MVRRTGAEHLGAIEFRKSLPRTSTGKPDRRRLRSLLET